MRVWAMKRIACSLTGCNSYKKKAKPVVKQGRKATDLIKDSRVANQDGHPGFFVFDNVTDNSI